MITDVKKIMLKDGTAEGDRERIALFFIMGNVEKFTTLQDEIYDFKERMIKPEVLEEQDFSSAEKNLLLLAFNLYNNWKPCPSVYEIFSKLDSENTQLALDAIDLRFN